MISVCVEQIWIQLGLYRSKIVIYIERSTKLFSADALQSSSLEYLKK